MDHKLWWLDKRAKLHIWSSTDSLLFFQAKRPLGLCFIASIHIRVYMSRFCCNYGGLLQCCFLFHNKTHTASPCLPWNFTFCPLAYSASLLVLVSFVRTSYFILAWLSYPDFLGSCFSNVIGRTNHVHLKMLPKGEWPKWWAIQLFHSVWSLTRCDWWTQFFKL